MRIRYNNALIKAKFYVLPQLPDNIHFLAGRPLLNTLGYKLVRVLDSTSFRHNLEPEFVDDFDEQSCELYPLSTDGPNLDLSTAKVNDESMKDEVMEVLTKYKETLSKGNDDIGTIDIEPVHIALRDDIHVEPVQTPVYGIRRDYRKPMDAQIQDLVRQRKLREYSNSPWRSSAFGRLKKTGDVRIVFDFRLLNDLIKSDSFPIPNIHKLLQKFRGKRYITSLDMKSGYWHIPLDEESRKLTAFEFNGVLYEWNVLPMGLKTAPAIFQRIMSQIFKDLDFVVVYIDDIAILSDNAEEHLDHLRQVFEVINAHGIKLRLDKCLFAAHETEYLGYYVNKYGYKPTDKYKQRILNVPQPTDKSEMQQFLGLIAYLNQFIPDLHDIAKPLYELLKKDVPFSMTDVRVTAFNKLKGQSPPRRLSYPSRPHSQ